MFLLKLAGVSLVSFPSTCIDFYLLNGRKTKGSSNFMFAVLIEQQNVGRLVEFNFTEIEVLVWYITSPRL